MRAFLLGFVTAWMVLGAEMGEVAQKIRANDLNWLQQAAEGGALNGLLDGRKNTPLLLAAGFGSVEAVEILLAAGANPNEANAVGITPLLAGAGEAAKVKALLAKGADVKAKTQLGQHALVVAAGMPRATESVKLLLAAGAPVNERGARGTTPLLSALGVSCAAENAKLLLAAGADVKAIEGAGMGAAHSIVDCPVEFVRDLIARGANVNAQNTFGGTVRAGKIQLTGLSPLMLAAAQSGPAKVKMLLEAGADVKAKDVRGMTPLHFAVSSEDQNPEIVKMLLAKGADVTAKDQHGEDALTWAKKFNRPEVLALFGAKAEPVAKTPLLAPKGPGVQAALARLEQGNESFFKESGCGGCHHSTLLSVAAWRGQQAGLQVNPGLAEARRQRTKGMLGSFSSALQQLVPLPGDLDSSLYALLEAKVLGMERTPEFEVLARYIWARQTVGGNWTMRGISRSPIEESDIHRTALAMWLLPDYSDAAAKASGAPRLREALRWLEGQKAVTTDELAMKLLGLKWGGASASAIAQAAAGLAKAQLADGSWGGNPRLAGDAFSTGFALFALNEGAGWKAQDQRMEAGAKWLRATQKEDGTWYVKSRAPKFQPYFESGFPYGHDQWISSAATAWAVAGLSSAAPGSGGL
jgi:ankyrin repeat protein